MSASAIHSRLNASLTKNIDAWAVIGDSGTGKLYTALTEELPSLSFENRGVGGENMSQIATRFRQEQLWRSHQIVIFDLSNDTVENNELYYPQIINDIRRPQKRYLIVQPGIAADAGDPSTHPAYIGGSFRPTIEAGWSSIETLAGDFYVPIMQALWDANDGSAGDLEDVDNGITPRSLRDPDDGLHLNAAGSTVVAEEVVAKMTSLGWI